MVGGVSRSVPSLDQVVRNLYGALSEEVRLDESLKVIAPIFRTHVTGVHINDYATQRARYPIIVGDMDAGMMQTLAREFESRAPVENLWMLRSAEGYLRQGYQFGEAIISDTEFLGSAYYQHYLRPADIRYGMGICLRHESTTNFTVVSLNRRAGEGPFGPSDFAIVEQLRPHLVNLYAIYRQFARFEETLGSLRAGFNRMPIGMLVLDADGKVLECNTKADQLLKSARVAVLTPEGTLRVRHSNAQIRLRDALTRLSSATAPPPLAILLPRPDEQLSSGLVLHLCAFPAMAADVLVQSGRILGFLYELSEAGNEEVGCRILQATLHLTATEARAALALRRHRDVEDVALALDVAVSTVRSHLKHIFLKTATSKQSELISLIDRIVSIAPC